MLSQQFIRSYSSICAVLSAFSPIGVGAASVNMQPVADTSIYSAFPTLNFGGGTTITAGGRPHGGESRALMLFHLQGTLPQGAIIQSVSLQMNVLSTPPNGAVNSVFDLDALTASWAEGTGSDRGGTAAGPNAATWNNRFGSSGSPWTKPGGDFSAAASAFVSVTGDGAYTFKSTPALVSNVQNWFNNPASNFGWVLRSESELTGGTIRRFGSRENFGNTPVLTIQYAVPEPAPCTFLLLGLAGVAWRYRAGRTVQS